jgi:hypothetical protein
MRLGVRHGTIVGTPPVLPKPSPAGGRRPTMIDAHAQTFDVTTSHVVAVDAAPEAVLAGLDRLELAQPVARTIELRGAAKRALASVKHIAERAGEPVAHGSVSGFPVPTPRAALARVA